MNANDILDAIGAVDDACIKKAKETRRPVKKLGLTIAALAACVAVALLIPTIWHSPAPQPPAKTFGECEMVHTPMDSIPFEESLAAIYEHCGPEADDDYYLVRLSVTGASTNVVRGDIETRSLISYTDTPVRIEEIYFAGANIEVSVGEEFNVIEKYYYDPEVDCIYSRLRTTPLVNGHEFFALIYRIPVGEEEDNGPYWFDGSNTVTCSYPVEPYEDIELFSHLDSPDYRLKYPAVREEFLDAFGAD